MNRSRRRATAAAVARIESTRASLEEDLRRQTAELRASVPGPGETIDEALVAVEAGIADLSDPRWQLVAGPALEELRACRDDLLRRKAMH